MEADSRNFYEKLYRMSACFLPKFPVGNLAKTAKAEADAEGSTEGARVQGVQRPCAGRGRQPLPREVMPASLRTGYCLTLESAGLEAKLPFSKATPAKDRRAIIVLNETDKA